MGLERSLDKMVADMEDHVSTLGLSSLDMGNAVQHTHGINEMLAAMKDYREGTAQLNQCFRNRDRNGLIDSLQQENRRILALEEENRQLKLALDDMQRGVTLIMQKHRQISKAFSESDAMVRKYLQENPQEKFDKMHLSRIHDVVNLTSSVLDEAEAQSKIDEQEFQTIVEQNRILREELTKLGATIELSNPIDFNTRLLLKSIGPKRAESPVDIPVDGRRSVEAIFPDIFKPNSNEGENSRNL